MTRLSARQLQRKAFLAKWSKVDWSKQNCELAVEMGLSGERIRQIRQQLGAPKATHHHQARKTAQRLQWAKDNLDKLKGLSAAELGRKYGLKARLKLRPLKEQTREIQMLRGIGNVPGLGQQAGVCRRQFWAISHPPANGWTHDRGGYPSAGRPQPHRKRGKRRRDRQVGFLPGP